MGRASHCAVEKDPEQGSVPRPQLPPKVSETVQVFAVVGQLGQWGGLG